MEEAGNVRLVRCPKCANLLPELPDFSVYQCGGCGTVLAANNRRGLLEDRVLETSGDGNGRKVSEQEDLSVGTNGIEPGRSSERSNNKNVVLNGSSSSGAERRGVLEDIDGSRRGRMESGFDQGRKARFADEGYQLPSNGPNDNRVGVGINNRYDLKPIRPDNVDLNAESKLENVRPPAVSVRTRATADQRGIDRSSSTEPHVIPVNAAGQGRFANMPDADVGPSNYHYRYGEASDGLARVKNLENDRAELLRKLDELTDQLTRSCDTSENPRERIHHDRRISQPALDAYDRHNSFNPGATRLSYGVNNVPIAPEKHVPAVPYANHGHIYGPYRDRHSIPFQEPYHPRNFPYDYGGYPDVYQPPMLSRPPSYQPPNRYNHEPRYERIPGHHVDLNQDLFMSHPHETLFHQPACSCFHCINMNRHLPSNIQPSRKPGQIAHHEYLNRDIYQHMNPLTYDRQGYISEGYNPVPPKPLDNKVVTRSLSDLDRETAGFGRTRLNNIVADNKGRRLLHPIAGGAPFVTCCNCFELLKLPRHQMSTQKTPRKLKCGACSSILLLELDGKGFAISVPEKIEQVLVKKVASSDSDMPDENYQRSQPYQDIGPMHNYDTYENFNYNTQSADPDPFPSSGDQESNFDRSQMRQVHNSSTSSSSEDEPSPDSVMVKKETCVTELSKDDKCLPVPDSSSSQEYQEHSSEELMHIGGQGNISKRIDQDRKTFRQNSLKDAVTATETDVSYNDHHVSHDFVETGKEEEDLGRINKGGESFFAGLFKRGFGDFSRSSKGSESRKSNVSVNGFCITDKVVRKAEKLAGPIQSGDYWYDHRAGFWGVMGHPCLGIIPPNIEEFNYPLPANCAGGNTDVFVNGRELHQKDLNLLISRGLPPTRHKSYLVEISGRVVDEDTGKELDGLGKLAPT
ncbi:OLC1v1029955C1 [Oldenlandia corymbosa var. corymbosa]|nr:OLC1v1029955C1 [Oldenlandia corymbosa var. corymbosa]